MINTLTKIGTVVHIIDFIQESCQHKGRLDMKHGLLQCDTNRAKGIIIQLCGVKSTTPNPTLGLASLATCKDLPCMLS